MESGSVLPLPFKVVPAQVGFGILKSEHIKDKRTGRNREKGAFYLFFLFFRRLSTMLPPYLLLPWHNGSLTD